MRLITRSDQSKGHAKAIARSSVGDKRRDDLFKINGGICYDLASAIAKNCPKAFVLVISNPVNSTVPIFAETFKKAGTFDPARWVLLAEHLTTHVLCV